MEFFEKPDSRHVRSQGKIKAKRRGWCAPR